MTHRLALTLVLSAMGSCGCFAVADATFPTAECHVLKSRVVVGEPTPIRIVLRNDTQETITTRYARECDLAGADCQVSAYLENNRVARWHDTHDSTAVWAGRMEPGDILQCTKLVLFLVQPDGALDGPPVALRPLGPGTYTVRVAISWRREHPLEAGPVEVEVAVPARAEDRCGAERVDNRFASWLSGGPPSEVLQECPGSIHVKLADEVAFVRKCVNWRAAASGPAGAKQLRDLIEGMSERLGGGKTHPFELELLNARVEILWKIEDFVLSRQAAEVLEPAIAALIGKYPHSTYAREAAKLGDKLQGE